MSSFRLAAALGLVASVSSGPVVASCGAAFCLVNTDWSVQGLWTEPGTRFSLRYESIDLDQPRAGSDRVAVGTIPRHHDEVLTQNRNTLMALEGGFASGWGYSVVLPFVDRYHEHVHNHRGERILETWDFARVGDLRAVARYDREPDSARSTGVGFLAGVKLPTGPHDVKNTEGVEAERTLQPGTGTTDLIAGAFLRGSLSDRVTWFGQLLANLPLNSRADYRPGRSVAVDGGIRYAAADAVGLLLQANALWRARDTGANAEPDDSGQRQLWLSPGITWNATRDLQLHAVVQWPLYQYANGIQLTADRAFSAGASWRF